MEREPYGKQSGRQTVDPIIETVRQAAEVEDIRQGTGWDPTIRSGQTASKENPTLISR